MTGSMKKNKMRTDYEFALVAETIIKLGKGFSGVALR